MPLLKMNLTYNLLGRLMRTAIVRGDTYEPPPPDPLIEEAGAGNIVRAVGWLHFVRNPIGDILVVMLLPAHQRAVREYFNAVAQGRMTQLLIALRCYQLEHGKLPDTLGGAGAGVPAGHSG